MNMSQRRRTLIPRIARHFEFTRLQDQLIAIAYHALIPVVSRPWNDHGLDAVKTNQPRE